MPGSTEPTDPVPARAAGRICAIAGHGQRDLQRCVRGYPDLFPPGPFDPTLFSMVCLANAFSAPWLDPARLRMANRAALWAFAVDRLIDLVATSPGQVAALVSRCRAVARGEGPRGTVGRSEGPSQESPQGPSEGQFEGLSVSLSVFLADIRDDLATAPEHDALVATWRREHSRMLAGMAREWRWRHGRARPSVEEYLDNADNLGLSFVFASHLVFTGDRAAARDASALIAAARSAQRVVRLVNDLATYERDLATGDLNVLRLGQTRRDVERRLDQLVARGRARLDRLRDAHPRPVGYLERQVEFNLGFHPVVDYWGDDGPDAE